MSKLALVEFKGMITNPGKDVRPPASCTLADNVLFDAPGIVRKRFGWERLSNSLGGPIWQLHSNRVLAQTNRVLAHWGTYNSATSLSVGTGSAAWTAITDIASIAVTRSPEVRQKSTTSQKNTYLTSDEGVRRLESGLTTLRFAGMPRGALNVSTLAAGTCLANGYGRAYRVTWHRKDAETVVLGGAPTARAIARNQAGEVGFAAAAQGVTLRIHIPNEFGTPSTSLTTSYFYRLWATRTQDLSIADPDDECFLIAEAFLTAANIAANYVDVTDTTPDSFLTSSGAPALHTNAISVPPLESNTEQGVVNEDAPPPSANDLANWQDCVWFADTTTRATAKISLVSALADGDTITVGTRTYTARNAPALATEFQIFAGFASAAANLERTLEDLSRCCNLDTSQSVIYSYVTSGTYPSIVFEVRQVASSLTLAVSAAKWLGITPTTGILVYNTQAPNALAFSKPGRADAVPPINSFTVGPTNSQILRIVPLRDRLIVFTTVGVFHVLGRTWADFVVQPFDSTFRLRGRECVAVCEDKVYAWCYEGIVEIDSSGVRVISTPISNMLERINYFTDYYASTDFSKICWAVAHNSKHRVQFWFPSEQVMSTSNYGGDTWLSYDVRTGGWSTGSIRGTEYTGTVNKQRTCGVVEQGGDRLLIANWNDTTQPAYLFRERRYAGAVADFTDYDADNSPYPVVAVLRFQWQQPDPLAAVHWQQLVLSFESDDGDYGALGLPRTFGTPPTALGIDFYSEYSTLLTAAEVMSPISGTSRVETPQSCRRAQELQVVIGHAVQEWFGLTSVAMQFRPAGTFARTT